MTLMTTLLFDKDPSFGSVSLNFVKNLFTFAVLRGIGLAWGPQAGMSKAAVTAAEIKVVLIQFGATWFMQIVEAEAVKFYKTGNHLTLEEVCTMTLENIAFTVAIMIGTKLAKLPHGWRSPARCRRDASTTRRWIKRKRARMPRRPS